MLSYVTGCPSPFEGCILFLCIDHILLIHPPGCGLPSAVVTSAVVNTVLAFAGVSAFSESQPVLP